ncbi:MAG: hypothetical protein FD130_2250, partial [Halothiobacillaceae bacterium]
MDVMRLLRPLFNGMLLLSIALATNVYAAGT